MPMGPLLVIVFVYVASELVPGFDAKYQAGGTNCVLDVLQALPTLVIDVPPVKIPVPVWTL